MAKTTAPLLSFDGSGSIAKTAVYSRWRGIKYVRRHVVPANPRTVDQQLSRNTFATLREMWKLAPTIAQEPWNVFAQGRPFLGLNAYIGENMRVVRGESDMQNFIGSPGARGGLVPTNVVAEAGESAGEIDVTFTLPDPPAGWTLKAIAALAFPDQEPAVDFAGPMVAVSEAPPATTLTLTDLPNDLCIVSAWVVWTKPNGDDAYSVGITTTATPAV